MGSGSTFFSCISIRTHSNSTVAKLFIILKVRHHCWTSDDHPNSKGFNQMALPARTITVAIDMSKVFDTITYTY